MRASWAWSFCVWRTCLLYTSIKISAPEEIAYNNGWITKDKLMESARRYGKSPYGEHLKRVAEGRLQY